MQMTSFDIMDSLSRFSITQFHFAKLPKLLKHCQNNLKSSSDRKQFCFVVGPESKFSIQIRYTRPVCGKFNIKSNACE